MKNNEEIKFYPEKVEPMGFIIVKTKTELKYQKINESFKIEDDLIWKGFNEKN